MMAWKSCSRDLSCSSSYRNYNHKKVWLRLIRWAFLKVCLGADLSIHIPASGFDDPNGIYRLDYNPPIGYPEPNITFRATDVLLDTISFSQGLPGTKYNFRLHYTNNTIHDWLTWSATITTIPDPPANLSINVTQKSHVQFTWDPPAVGGFTKFKLRLIPLSDGGQPRNFIEKKAPVTLRDLVAGASYEIQLYTLFENKESTVYISGNFTTNPESITKINATYISDREITLEWDTPMGDYDAFEVQYINIDERLVIHLALHPSITITGLKPFKNYTFTVLVESGRDTDVPRKSIPVSAVFTTKESKPGKIQFFNPIDVSLNNITFEWTLSEGLHNGILTEYVIKYGVKDEPLNASQSFGPNESRGTIKGLQPGVWYVFSIEAHTQIGAGEPSMLTKKMPIISPSPDVRPTEDGKTSTSITIKFRDNFFSHKNGEIKMYTIIVSEDYYDTNIDPDRPRSWADVQSLDRWPAYMVVPPYNPFANRSARGIADFEIGQNASCNPHQKVHYCNGPLKSGRTYYIKIRAFTDDGKTSETAYESATTNEDYTWLGYTVFIPVSFAAVMFIICLVYVRRRNGTFCKRAKDIRHGDTLP